jgi:hypothetical protein
MEDNSRNEIRKRKDNEQTPITDKQKREQKRSQRAREGNGITPERD